MFFLQSLEVCLRLSHAGAYFTHLAAFGLHCQLCLIGLQCLWKPQCERERERERQRGSPPDPSGGRPCQMRHSAEGRRVATEVIPEFKSAEVLCAPEQCVTASQQRQDPPSLVSQHRDQNRLSERTSVMIHIHVF